SDLVSIKQELNGVASTYLHSHVQLGDVLDVSAPRGVFTLRAGDRPIVLLSAGVGRTQVLQFLHPRAPPPYPAPPTWWASALRLLPVWTIHIPPGPECWSWWLGRRRRPRAHGN